VHCIPDENLEFDENGTLLSSYDVKLLLESEGDEEDMYVNIRPFLRKCIMKLKKLYQVVVWTASTQDYADAIINHIDPYYELFEARYYRDNCVRTEQSVHMKDMRMF